MFAVFTAFLLKSTVILAAACIAVSILRRQSAAIRYIVWVAAAVAILALPVASFSFRLPALRFPAPAAAQVFLRADATALRENIAVTRNIAAVPAGRMHPGKSFDWRLASMLLWLAGSLAGLAGLLLGGFAVAQTRRRAEPIQNDTFEELADHVELMEMARPNGIPMACGILRPAILLPREMRAWSEERLRVVLLHEMAHIRRRDVMTLTLAHAALRLCWWNPLAWFAARELVRECERATDDAVLNAGILPSEYAAHLLDIARSVARAQFCPAAPAMVGRSQTEARVEAILDELVNRRSPGRSCAVATAAMTLAILIPLAAVRAQDATPPAAPLQAQATPVDAGALILAATSQKKPELLENAATAAEQNASDELAQRLLEAAAELRANISGSTSSNYGLGLLKIADFERRHGEYDLSADYYQRATDLLGDRPEAAHALITEGVMALSAKKPSEAAADFERAGLADPNCLGIAWMWQAIALDRSGDTAKAEEDFRNAVDASRPDTQEGQIVLRVFSNFLARIGQTEEAEKLKNRIPPPQPIVPVELPADVYRIGPGIMPPVVRSRIEPDYSQEARVARFTGTVLISTVVGADGVPTETKVVRAAGLGLDEKAIQAVNKWRFDPGIRDGQPVKVVATIQVNFRLQ